MLRIVVSQQSQLRSRRGDVRPAGEAPRWRSLQEPACRAGSMTSPARERTPSPETLTTSSRKRIQPTSSEMAPHNRRGHEMHLDGRGARNACTDRAKEARKRARKIDERRAPIQPPRAAAPVVVGQPTVVAKREKRSDQSAQSKKAETERSPGAVLPGPQGLRTPNREEIPRVADSAPGARHRHANWESYSTAITYGTTISSSSMQRDDDRG